MSLTKAQIRDRVANDLGILALGQSLQSQDVHRIEQAYNEVYDDLKENGLAIWALTDVVPDKVVPHIVALIAFNCLNTYGVSNDRYIRIKANYDIAEKKIRELVSSEYVPMEEPTDY
jgi:hypothetical protein